jgi:poly-gamma-glutamate capsule biosynthesis protein CapA/YwtB (metallophosphatase superfamily)
MKIIFTGDLFIGTDQIRISDRAKVFFSETDMVVSDFENVLHNDALMMRMDKSAILTFTKKHLENYITLIGQKILFNLGNNHINDYGNEGVNDTLQMLSSFPAVSYTGAGYYKDVTKPFIFDKDGLRIAILTVSSDEPEVMSVIAREDTQGVLDYQDPEVLNIIKKTKPAVDYFIIIPHWGKEYSRYPAVQIRKLAYKWIDAGADMVVGHHPHIIQGKEIYNNKTIYYNLGNFIFPNFRTRTGVLSKWQKWNNSSILLLADFSREKISIAEKGLYFDTKTNLLHEDSYSLRLMNERSTLLDLQKLDMKRYYAVWLRSYYKALRNDFGFPGYVKRIRNKIKKTLS